MSPALAGGFLTTAPPGKSQGRVIFKEGFIVLLVRKYINTKINISIHGFWLNGDWIYLTKLAGSTFLSLTEEEAVGPALWAHDLDSHT